MKLTQYDVIISGAGPVGLFLACELALAKCSVLVLEKSGHAESPFKKIPFGLRGLSSLSVESFSRRGMFEKLELHKRIKNPHQNAVQGARRQVGHFAGIPFLEGDIDTSQWKYRLPSSTETNVISEIQELETVLSQHGQDLGVEIKRGFAVTDFQQTANEVTVQSGDHIFKASWLVGCDGARSVVRKLGGFEFAGTEPEFTGYTTLVDIEDSSMLKPGRNVTETGMYMQSQPGYVIMQDFDGGVFHKSEKPLTREHVQEVLRRISGTDVTVRTLHLASCWTDRARQVTTYRKGRVFLAGDAAHIHSPLGGQGLNLGLGDAMNLGWKLAAAIHKNAPEGLLETYQTERYPVGMQVLDWSRAQVAIMKPGPSARALNSIFRDLIKTRDGATYFAGRVWGLHTRYDLFGGHPLVGCSAPNFEFEDGRKIDELMRKGQGLLLDFGGNGSLKILANEYGEQIKYLTGKVKETLGLSAVLIRPDGIVAWVSEQEPQPSSLREAMALWFMHF